MWKYPRMVAWVFITCGLILLFRLPFVSAQMIPYCLSFNPGVVFVPLAGALFGPAGVWGSLLAALLGDWITGMWGGLTVFRALGYALFAYHTQRLWDVPGGRERSPRPHDATWRATMRFLCIALSGCFVNGSWLGLGAEVWRLYPFPYFASLVVLHNAIFVVILGIPFYRIVVRDFVPHWGTWRDAMQENGRTPVVTIRKAILLWVGSVGSCCVGSFAGWLFTGIRPLTPFVLGTTCGWGVIAIVVLFLGLHVYGLRAEKGQYADPRERFSWR